MIFLKTAEQKNFIADFIKLTRGGRGRQEISAQVADIIADVQKNGNAAVIKYARKFDGVDLTPDQFFINLEDVEAESIPISEEEKQAIRFAYDRIRAFAEETKPQDSVRSSSGCYVAQKYVPLDRVACYVPCGSFPLVSTVLHTVVFAKVAGVKDVVMMTSPKAGGVYPAMLYAAKVAGVSQIMMLGGVYGVAAAAYGTETIRPVQSIAGPGNAYVTEAKKQVFGTVSIDMLAGPSEIMVIADDSANPDFVAADLLSQAEHGSGMEQAVLVTTSQGLFDCIEERVLAQRAALPEAASMDQVIDTGIFIIKAESLSECVAICNAYAPEHVEVLTENPDSLEPLITSAGAIMLGPWTPEPIGDFVAGSSHVLPTGGAAHIFSGLTTGHFMKKIGIQKFDKDTLGTLRQSAEGFAKMEMLPAHGRSVSIRFDG